MVDTAILVTGATGAQGGAVIDSLIEASIPARALVRDPSSPRAQALAARGVELAKGTFDDRASLANAMRDVRGVFSMQNPPRPPDLNAELRAGRNLIEAALITGVETFVHTSVARAGDQQHFVGWEEGRWWTDYWNSKSGVNDMVRAAGFPHWTVLKPAYMMINFVPPKVQWMYPSLVRDSVIETAMTPDTTLDLIDAADIGNFAAAAFADPARFDRQDIDLASETLTMREIAETLSRAAGRQVGISYLSPEMAVARGNNPGLVKSEEWCNVEGYRVDLAKVRSWGIPLARFENWAARHAGDLAIGTG
jgi:uncharacterized protein YbjT (DUF2867 family)